jgi:hypothetical protein
VIQENIKKIYYRRTNADEFQIGENILKWDSRNEERESMENLRIYGKVH